MKVNETLRRLRTGLFQPSAWERDPGFRASVDEFVRRGAVTAGVLAILAVAIYLVVNLAVLGKEPVFRFPQPTEDKVFVVLWDKILVAAMGALLASMYRWNVTAAVGRWIGIGVVVAVSAASVFDDVQGGDVGFAPVYPTLFMLVAVGTLMLRPLQTLAMSIVVAGVVFLGESLFAFPGVGSSGIVPEQVPFMFVVSVVLTGISMTLYVMRHEQYLARTHAERLEQQIAAYASDLEKKADDLEREKSRAERHALALEAEQALTKEQARQLTEAEALKDRFFANISHEFRTPLTLILGPLEDALQGEHGRLPSQLTRQLSIMKSSGERLLHLVNDLLDLSRLDAGAVRLKPESLEVVEFLTPIVRTFGDLAHRRGVKLTFESEVDSLEARFDPDAIEKVVYNLVSNALKFTPHGGSVRIRLFTRSEGDSESVGISVRDTGPGIPRGDLAKIFDRFHQVSGVDSGSVEGTGLGLALVRELVQLHGGEVDVQSELEFGSEFTIWWPSGHRFARPMQSRSGATEIFQAEEVRPEAADGDVEDASQDAPLVLVVDNDADVRGYIRSRLRAAYRVSEAGDGVDAFDRIAAERPALVICDVMMPRMDGVEFCRRLRSDRTLADIPVVLLTARADDESRLEGLKSGADDYMSKPFSSSELIARVENLIEIRRLVRARSTNLVEPSPIDVPSVDHVFLDQARDIVEQHLGDTNFGVEWLADEMALSSRQLQRKIKKITTLSAAGFIRLMRLKRAEQLLARKAGNVSEVAYAVGFRDTAHFSKLFRQTFGVLPSDVPEESEREPDES